VAFKSSLASLTVAATVLPPSLSCTRNKTKPWGLTGKEGTGDGAVRPPGWEHLGKAGRWRRVVQGGVSHASGLVWAKVVSPFRRMYCEASYKAEDAEIFLLPSNRGRGILMQGFCFLFPEGP